MTDHDLPSGLEGFGSQLDKLIAADSAADGPARRGGARRRPSGRPRGRTVGAVAAVAVLVAAPAWAVTGGFDFGGDVPAAGEPGGAPLPVTAPSSQTVQVISILDGPGGVDALRRRLAASKMKVRVEGRPVAPAAVGRIFGVQFPHSARFDQAHRLVVTPNSRGTVIVTVGQPAGEGEEPSTAGLSLYEVLPKVRDAVHRNDPGGTLRRLRALGFGVTVKLIVDNPNAARDGTATGVKTVKDPPAGTVVLSVLNADGANAATRQTRDLMMEVAPADSKVARSEP